MRVVERKVDFISENVNGTPSDKTYFRERDGGVVGKLGGADITQTQRLSYYDQTKQKFMSMFPGHSYSFGDSFEQDKNRFSFVTANDIVTVTSAVRANRPGSAAKSYSFTAKFNKLTDEMISFELWDQAQ